MRIQDAIQSGKWFKRMKDKKWYSLHANAPATIIEYVPVNVAEFTIEDILATDWEVKP